MKKIYFVVLLLLSVFLVSVAVSGQGSKKITEKDVQKCIAKKKKEAKAKGYPLTDPFAVRIKCINELKGE